MHQKQIFQRAAEFDTLELRERFLDQQCGDDWRLRERLDALLRQNDEGVGDFLKTPLFTRDTSGEAERTAGASDEVLGFLRPNKDEEVEGLGWLDS